MSTESLKALHLQTQSLIAGESITMQDLVIMDEIVNGMKSITDGFNAFTKGAKDALEGIMRDPLGKNPQALVFGNIDVNDSRVVKVFKARPYTTFDDFLIRVPEGLVGQMRPYITSLHATLTLLSSVDERLLDPLVQWAAGILARPERASQVLNADRGRSVVADIDKELEKMKKLFSGTRSDEMSHGYLMKVYPSPEDFKETGAIINSTVELCSKILKKNLSKKATDTSAILDELLKEHMRSGILKDGRKALLVSLSKLTYETARELEMISVLMFQVKAVNQAHIEAIEKLRKIK